MVHELYYWPGIQGRGEFIRLALEEAGAQYVDVARRPESEGGGAPALLRLMQDRSIARAPFAPPFLRAGDLLIAQTANILLYLGPRLGLVPQDESSRMWAHQLQLTIADFLKEVHDTHHPIASSLFYEEQKPEALRRAKDFVGVRLPKFLGYFEQVLDRNASGGHRAVGTALGYVDLSLFQMIAGLRYAFPRAMARLEPSCPHLVALHREVAARERIAAYLASERRLEFNDKDIFRHYPELD